MVAAQLRRSTANRRRELHVGIGSPVQCIQNSSVILGPNRDDSACSFCLLGPGSSTTDLVRWSVGGQHFFVDLVIALWPGSAPNMFSNQLAGLVIVTVHDSTKACQLSAS